MFMDSLVFWLAKEGYNLLLVAVAIVVVLVVLGVTNWIGGK